MRQLTERDRARILDYVGHEPEVNLYIIGDVENFGLASDKIGIYVHETAEWWDSLVLKYFDDFVVYSRKDDYDAGPVAAFLKTQDIRVISGKGSLVARLSACFPERQLSTMLLTKCARVKTGFAPPAGVVLRKLSPDDAEDTISLLADIDEFKEYHKNKASSVEKLRANLTCGGTACGAFLNGRLVACAQTTAENSRSAMVVGVATRVDMRGQGYASAVVAQLCTEAFKAGKEYLCLFYENPQAGRIYNRIGFEHIGEYSLLV